MKRPYSCLVATLLLLSGCSQQAQPESATTIFRDFSLPTVVERMDVPELVPQSGGSGYAESLGETIRRRREFDLTYRLNEGADAKFDEAIFIGRLKVEIEKVLGASDVRLDGSGSDDNSFNFDYSKAEHSGWVEVIGARVEGDHFKLWGVIREHTQRKKE